MKTWFGVSLSGAGDRKKLLTGNQQMQNMFAWRQFYKKIHFSHADLLIFPEMWSTTSRLKTRSKIKQQEVAADAHE